MSANRGLHLDSIIFLGRTYAEYVGMFGLERISPESTSVLDCPSGPSSFTAEWRALGGRAVAADSAYSPNVSDLAARGRAALEIVGSGLATARSGFRWDHFRNPEELRVARGRALERFLDDYLEGWESGRYVHAVLPHLPFEDRSFDLVLSGHFLFTYDDRLDLEFHRAVVAELRRVARSEVRVYPLVGLQGERSPHLEPLLDELRRQGVQATVQPVGYEFQLGANEMLRLSLNA